VLRRASFGADERHPSVLSHGPLMIDYAQHLVTFTAVKCAHADGSTTDGLLGQNVGRTLTKRDILLRVWGNGYQDEAHLLRVTSPGSEESWAKTRTTADSSSPGPSSGNRCRRSKIRSGRLTAGIATSRDLL
jgi:hypothetical protein